jgi:hypothetical protein
VKGVAQVIDALAGIAILAIFVLGGFSVVDGQQWGDYQNSIAAEDLGYTLERSGLTEDYVNSSDFGDVKSIVETASGGTVEPSLEELNMPKRVEVGMHVHQDEIERINFSQVDYPDECMDNPTDSVISGYDETGKPPLVSTENNSNNLMNVTGVEVYLGQIERQDTRFASELNYNALWVERQSQCDFKGPYLIGENFYWGNRSDSKPGGIYQFYDSNSTSSGINWNGTLEVHEAEYVENITDELESEVAGFETYTDVNTFRISDDVSIFDVLVFRNRSRSIELIEDSSSVRDDLEAYLEEGGNIFLQANLNPTTFNDYDRTLQDLAGYQWFDHEYDHDLVRRCDLNSDNGLETGCNYNITFSDSRAGLKMKPIFEKDLSGNNTHISLPVNNSVYSMNSGPLTGRKGVYLQNFYYEGFSSGIEAELSDVSSGYPGESLHSDGCDVHSSQVELFPTKSGDNRDREFSIIEVEDSSGSCSEKYVVGVENKDSRLYSQRETVTINGVKFRVNIIDSSDLELRTNRIPNIGLFKFNYMDRDYPKIGLSGYYSYPENYTEDDYKILASAIYYLSLPHKSSNTASPQTVTETIGSIESDYRPYRIEIGWDW